MTSKSRDPCREPLLVGSTGVTRALESADTDKIARPLGEKSMDVTKIICARFNVWHTDKLAASTIDIAPSLLPIARNLRTSGIEIDQKNDGEHSVFHEGPPSFPKTSHTLQVQAVPTKSKPEKHVWLTMQPLRKLLQPS